MVIQHNLSAMNANRFLGVTATNYAKSSEKLSSGYRINRAGDDAAGLAISEKMRGQIRGLNKASENAEDGISLIQTAEGAMQESQNILQRMRELSVQAANDTYTESDRECIQVEIDELTKEIDRIAHTTEFNTKKLIDGTYTRTTDGVQTKIQEWLKGSWLQDAMTRIKDATGLGLTSDCTLKVEFNSLGSTTVAQMSSANGGTDFKLEFNKDFIDGLTVEDFKDSSGPDVGGILFDRLLTHEITHAVTRHNMNSSMTDVPLWFMEGLAEAVQGNSRSPLQTEDEVRAIMNGFNKDVSGEAAYSAGFYAVSFMANWDSAKFSNLLSNLKTSTSFEAAVQSAYGQSLINLCSFINSQANFSTTAFLSTSQITLGDGLEDALGNWDKSPKDVVQNSGTPEEIKENSERILIDGRTWNVAWAPQEYKGKDIRLQIGANAGQELRFNIGDMRSTNLIGEDPVKVTSHDDASGAITIFDKAIQKVSGFRSSLGAIQNRLEHTIANLDNSAENLQASESKIRDTDMAEEITRLSKNNILMQAGQSMLAQANQSTQGVISLLQ